MRRRRALVVSLGVLIIGLQLDTNPPGVAALHAASALWGSHPPLASRSLERFANLPLAFEPNLGQADPAASFVAHSGGATIVLAPKELQVLAGAGTSAAGAGRAAVHETVQTMSLVGAGLARMSGRRPFQGRANYFIGQDPTRWITGVPRFAAVRYHAIYPRIDLTVTGHGGDLEYDFTLAQGADPRAITLGFPGADEVSLDRLAGLVVTVGGTRWTHRRAFAYQQVAGHVVPVRVAFRIDGQRHISFALGAYDPGLPLVIDPVLSYSTYLGGSDLDVGYGVAVDPSGSAYVVGQTWSSDFPVKGGLPVQKGLAFVSKMTPDGSDLVYSTYLGGSEYQRPLWGYETAFGVAVDATGNAYVVGQTRALDFPVVNAIQDTYQGGLLDAFVSKFDPSGSALVYSTYLGGESEDWASAVTVDAAGSAYVTGYTYSYMFPLKDPLPMETTGDDAFVSKLDPAGSSFAYSTRFGGYTPFLDQGSDGGQGIAVDSTGAVVFAGWTESSVFPLVNPFQSAYGGGTFDGFVAKLSPAGDSIIYSSYFGGNGLDQIQALALDGPGAAYVTGWTASKDLPTRGPIEACLRAGDNYNTSEDAFVAKVSPTGSLVYSTYLGGDGLDFGRGITVDAAGIAYVVGDTMSFDFPSVHPIQSPKGQEEDGFVTAIGADGSRLMFSTFLGGGSTRHFYFPPPSDHAYAVAIDGTGNLYVSGDTAAPDFPTRHAFQRSIAGGSDGFVAKISSPKGSPSRYHKSCVAPVDFDPYQSHDVGSWPASVAIGDVTGDGLNDALMTTSSYRPGPADHKLFVFPQQPDGSLGPPTAYPFYGTYGATYQFGVAVGDLDGDGLQDAAVAMERGVVEYIQRNGRFLAPVLVKVPGMPQHLEIADVTGDGRADMVVATSNNVVLLVNSQPGFRRVLVSDQEQLEVEVGDVTGDGLIDVVGCTEPRSMNVFAQNPDGSFGPGRNYDVLDDGESTPSGVEVADVTGDGRADVVVSLGGNVPDALIDVFAQRPDGTLAPPMAYHTRDIPEPVEAADLTGDGRADVVSANGGWYSISVNLQERDGALGPYQMYWVSPEYPPGPSEYEPKGLALGDLNNDGRVDVALADYLNGLVVLYQSSP